MVRRSATSRPDTRHNGQVPAGDAEAPKGTANAVPLPGVNAEASPKKPDDPLADFTPAEPPPAIGIPDPETELDAYKSAAQVDAMDRPPPRITALLPRRPNDQEFLRVMPGGGCILPLFKSKADGDRLYLFKKDMEPYLPAKAIRPYRLVLAKSLRAIVPFIWPLPVPQDDMGQTWHNSANAAADAAETAWIKMEADMVGGCYVFYPAEDELPEPEWPREPLAELILLAFKNRRIEAPDHPIIRRLGGKLI
jgi:hypothetical protein